MRAILSDLDGTLVDSTDAVLRVWHGWMRDRAVTPPGPGEHPHGIPARQVVAQLAPHLDALAEAQELERREIEDLDGVVALPGAETLLRAAASDDATAPPPHRDSASPPARGGDGTPVQTSLPPIAVVTSCTRPLALARLGACRLPIPRVLVTAELTQRVKPDPDPYLLGAERLGVAPADCVVLEDAPAGIAAGRAAGMRVVAVRASHPDADLVDADEIVDDVAGFLARFPA
jgi:sugar-phosphatase